MQSWPGVFQLGIFYIFEMIIIIIIITTTLWVFLHQRNLIFSNGASLLRFPGLFSVFWPILVML